MDGRLITPPDWYTTMTTHANGDTTLAALAHASALVAAFFGPLLFLLLADDDDELVQENAKNALNFQIVLLIATLIAAILVLAFIGILLLPLLGVIDLIFVLIGTVKASNGEIYAYPLTPDIV
jgi:uncharacterized Tic20 family protein